VDCIDTCVLEAGPPPTPPAGTPTVSTDALEVSIQLDPPSPDSASFAGYFTLTVSAHNAANHDVLVELPPSGDAGPSLTFVLTVARGSAQRVSGNYRAYDAGMTHFGANETKRQVFDFHLGSDVSDGGLPSGAYTAYATFGDSPAQPIEFTLGP